MLSRASLLSGQCRALVAFARPTTSTAINQSPATDAPPTILPRPVRLEPGKVRYGFFPEEWFSFFYKKTGVTGPYAFAFTLTTYLLSKEIYVLDHEYYNGISVFLMYVIAVKKFGPPMAKYLDEQIDAYEKELNENREDQKNALQNNIQHEEKMQWSAEGQTLLTQAKRENVLLQLEAEYRQRMMNVYGEVKKRLDYQVQKIEIEKRAAHKCMVDYVVAKVQSAITPDQDKANIEKCIADLSVLAKA